MQNELPHIESALRALLIRCGKVHISKPTKVQRWIVALIVGIGNIVRHFMLAEHALHAVVLVGACRRGFADRLGAESCVGQRALQLCDFAFQLVNALNELLDQLSLIGLGSLRRRA